jgi:alpha-beta hydrolase superfamily lysophospholipase
LARLCSVFAPRTRFRSSIRPDQLTRDPAARRVRENDPLRCHSVTANWYFQVLDAMVAAWEEASRLTVPTLLLQGDLDEVVNPEAAMTWWLTLPSKDKTLRLLGGHVHELLSEPDWMQTADGILAWLEHRFPEANPLAFSTWINRPAVSIPGQSWMYSLVD